MVVAEFLDQAKDAMELIEVCYAPMPAVTSSDLAMAPSAPAVEMPATPFRVWQTINQQRRRVHA
jgi:CO/xanthine dehydrogenase Mo-binding subunit